jgi:O-antigen/teichoic acid export membrane protein
MGNLVIRGFYTLATFGISVLLTRLMGASVYGVYSYIYSILLLLCIPSQFGLPTLIIRETAKSLEKLEWGRMRGLWQWSAGLALLIAFFVAVVAFVIVYFTKIPLSADQISSVEWGVTLVPLLGLCALVGASLRGIHKVNLSQFPEQVFLPGLFALLIGAAWLFGKTQLTSTDAVKLQVVAAAISAAGGLLLLYFKAPRPVLSAHPEADTKTWLPSVIVLALNSGIQAINKQLSVIILGLFVIASQVGIYRVAVQMALLVDIGFNVINPVIAPEFARLYLVKDQRRLQLLSTKSARIVLTFNLLVTGAFILFGRQFLNLVYGPEFVAAYIPLLILLVGQLVNSIAGSIGYLMNMTGNEKTNTLVQVVATGANIILNFVLTPVWGIIGAAIAASVSIAIWNVWLWIAGIKLLGINSSVFGRVQE